jgi:DNA polymerase I
MATALFPPGAKDVLYVVDLSSYLLRAYHAVAPLSAPNGEPTHAVHGTVTMLERLYREQKPHLLAIAMDAGRGTFRKEIYQDYKANRPPAPEDLRVQIGRAEEIIRASGYTVWKQEGVEADDLIATAATQAEKNGLKVVVVGADKDLMQLCSERVVLWDTLRNKVFGPPEVVERFGVGPEQLGDLLALTGDSSDNIPGVPSVGPKTAAELLHRFGHIDGIFSHLGEIERKKLRETLTEHEGAARLSRRLVSLKLDCPLDLSEPALRFDQAERRDVPALKALYGTLGFRKQLAALEAAPPATSPASMPAQTAQTSLALAEPPPPAAEQSVTLVTESSPLDALLERLGAGTWALELCTTHPSTHRGPLVAACLVTDGAAFYLPFSHRRVGAPPQLPASETTRRVLEALTGGTAKLCVHGIKRAILLARGAGVRIMVPAVHDAELASYLLDPEQSHTVEALGLAHGVRVPEFDELAKEGRRKLPLDELEVERSAALFAARGQAVLAAFGRQAELLAEQHLAQLLETLELPLARQLADLEERGVRIDVEVLRGLGHACETELLRLEQAAHAAAGKAFNVASPRQLETILFDDLGLKPLKRTKTSRSTDAQTLDALAEEHPLPALILEHRQIAKLKGTYIDALPTLVDAKTGRLHGSWEQAVAATGRISSVDPNLQNIPIRSELGRSIRAAFVAPPGQLLLSADYSQIELRVLAHLSGDQRLVEAFRTGQDVHTRTAMEIFEVPEDQVTRDMRARSKAVNFGVIYGQGEGGLSRALGIERKVAASFIAAYFRRYEGVRRFMEETLERARQGEAVQSLLGRRRIVPDIKSGNRARRLAAERIAMNMPIQGSAADILKLAMLRLTDPPTPGCQMILTVHDELVFEVPADEALRAAPLVKQAMETAYQLVVPLTVSVGSGPNWNAAH